MSTIYESWKLDNLEVEHDTSEDVLTVNVTDPDPVEGEEAKVFWANLDPTEARALAEWILAHVPGE